MKKRLLFLLLAPMAWATTYNSDGSQTNVNTLIAGASAGDTVTMPAGTFTWGVGGLSTSLDKAITLLGAGVGQTIINLSTEGPTGANGGVIRFTADGPTASGFSVNGATGVSVTAFWMAANVNNWRITQVYYTGTTTGAYAVYGSKGSDIGGLIDFCTFIAGSTTSELIYFRGTDNSWDLPDTVGTANNLVVENCTFGNTASGAGYVCDINANGHAVFRFNTITGQNKIDGHGASTNSPAVSFRNMEVYGNVANAPTGTWRFIEIRGGTGMVWGNVNKSGGTASTASIRMTDYGATTQAGAFNYVYQTPNDYPLTTQVGRGQFATPGDPASAVSDPMYWWENRKAGSLQSLTWDSLGSRTFNTDAAGYSAGVSTITITGAGGSASSASAGSYFKVAGDSTYYLITSGTTSNPGSITFTPALTQPIPASATALTYSAVTNYQGQEANPSATYVVGPTAPAIIAADRDYFNQVASFDGSTGVGVGTQAQMNAITPTTVGVGFWVTDLGTWNQSFTGTVAATALAVGDYAEIVSVGTTDFTLIGAVSNTVGERFLATGVGTGTGTAKPAQGQLWVANESLDWEFKYEPYIYPYNSNPVAPVIYSATVNSAGTQLTTVFSVSCTTGAGGAGGMTVSASAGAATLTYASGSGSATYVWDISRAINTGETVTISYTQPGNGIESTADQVDLGSFSGYGVTNSSTVNNTQAAVLGGGITGGGF